MSIFTIIGLILLCCAFLLFGYQVLSAFLDMGTSDEFVYESIRMADILEDEYAYWVDNIPMGSVQNLAEYIINLPLVVWLLGMAILFFLTQVFRTKKTISK
jgi:hypothetical protein